ncbi:MAG: IS66 family transposase [Bacteroidetes bacterium]|nr:IS66 family transposase [Bacteroidota bacterium]
MTENALPYNVNATGIQDILQKKDAQIERLTADNLYLKHELEKLKRMLFGAKSERFISDVHPSQLTLGLGVDPIVAPEPEKETVTYERQKPAEKKEAVHSRQPLPSHLPRQEVILEPENKEEGAKKIGEEVTEVLEYTPGQLYVKKYVRPKYAQPQEKGIVIANLPSLPIPKGNAGASLIAYIIISKFCDHLPFYRQVQMFKRLEISIAESTINDWFKGGCEALEPLYEELLKLIRQTTYLQADETPIPVLDKDHPGATHQGYHWVYHSPPEKIVIFDYQRGRGKESPKNMLKDFKGHLQTDGYAGYDTFERQKDITLLACMAHARRKFDEALKNDKVRAGYFLEKVQELYAIERYCRENDYDNEKRKALRQEKALPILIQLEEWLKENIHQVLPQSGIGKAIAYTLGLWHRLKRYVDNGNVEIDNNLIENSIRPVALGRKNYLFAGSHDGAKRAAIIYSFLGTCKMNNVNPAEWLTDVLNRIHDHKAKKLSELLPQNWKPS